MVEPITSKQNKKIKLLKILLKDKNYMFLDNPKLIVEAKKAGFNIDYLLINETYNGKTDYGGENVVVSESVFKSFSQTVNSQGLIGILKYGKKTLKKPQADFLVLDELQDPGNVGTLLRSALGANFKDVYLLNSARVSSDKVVRSSMGAIFKLNIYECSKDEFLNMCSGLHMCYADMFGDNVYKTKLPKNIGVVVGNEGNGVSKELRKVCTQAVAIPMANGLESLNASVAGSIIMYQIYSRRWFYVRT